MAAEDGAPLIAIEGSCPDEPAIDTAIRALIPRGVAALPEAARVDVADLGETYRVQVKSGATVRARLFRDAGRDCEQRARFAAVFIVLTLLPPELGGAAPVRPPPAPAPAPASPAPPPVPAPPQTELPREFVPPPAAPPPGPPPSPRGVVRPPPPAAAGRWRLELSAVFDAAPSVLAGTSMVAPGGEIRAVRAVGPLALTAGVGLEPRASFSIGGLDGRAMRLPMDVSVRVQRALAHLELGGELGLAVAPFHAEGLNTARPSSGTRLDVGARAGATVRFARPATRLAPFLGLHLELFPWPFEIAARPTGGLGTTPVLWLGAQAGLSIAP